MSGAGGGDLGFTYKADRDARLAGKWANVWHQLRIEDAAGIA